MNASAPDLTKRTPGLFALLFAIGLIYLGSLAYFLHDGVNFVDAEKVSLATQFAQAGHLTLPERLTFDSKSEWSKALAVGWNRPESWGVWSSKADASIILPAITDAPSTPVCFTFAVRGMEKMHNWPLAIAINGRPFGPQHIFTDGDPHTIQGNIPISKSSLLHIEFVGPEPKIPNLLSKHTNDPRDLGFSLLWMSLTAQCSSP